MQSAIAFPTRCAPKASIVLDSIGGQAESAVESAVAPTLRATHYKFPPCVVQGFDGYNGDLTGDKAATLGINCGTSTGRNGVIAVATQQGGAEISDNGVCPTVTAAAGMSGNNQPWVCYGISSFDSNAMKSANPHSGIYVANTSRTLDLNGGNPACNQGGIAIVCRKGEE